MLDTFPANDNACTPRQRVHALSKRSDQSLVHELRHLLGPWLTPEALSQSSAPLVLRLLEVRLRAGKLSAILALRRHPQMNRHPKIREILSNRDPGYLELLNEVTSM